MLIKMLDDCRFDFFCDVICCLFSGILLWGVELYCNIRCWFGLIEIYDIICWFFDIFKFVVVEIYVFLCLFIKLVVVIDVLGNKSNNIKCLLFFFEISCNLN